MTGDPNYIKPIRAAARKRSKARQAERAATDELRVACLQAKHQGVSISEIALNADVSRQAIYDWLGEQPSR